MVRALSRSGSRETRQAGWRVTRFSAGIGNLIGGTLLVALPFWNPFKQLAERDPERGRSGGSSTLRDVDDTRATQQLTTSEPRRKRTSNDPQLITIYWRDIPAQVTARAGRTRASVALDDRFQVAIDGAATRAGMTDNDDYLGEWREERVRCGEDLESELEKRKSELEAEFSPSVLREYVKAGGWGTTGSP